MKIKFEFDTLEPDFEAKELKRYIQANNTAYCLNAIANKVYYWYEKDDREEIPTDEISDTISEIIKEHDIDLDKLV